MLALIGGTGLSRLTGLQVTARRAVRTPYGEPSCPITLGELAGSPVAFMARHGYGHTLAPHEVNYRANIWALRDVGVTQIIAIASVGGIRGDCVPGSLVLPDQIIDYTWGRPATFFEGPEQPVRHIDFTHPYSARVRRRVAQAARDCSEPLIEGATYGATQGPRLETAAEITRLERDGCDVVGMTGMPEASLAREIELEYAALAVVVNHAAGRGASVQGVHLDALATTLEAAMARVHRVLAAAACLG
jgi:5'-methylthioadenosine phosphorylase